MAEAGLLSFQIAEIVDAIAIIAAIFAAAAIAWLIFR